MIRFFAYVIVSGVHGGTHHIQNTEEAMPTIFRLAQGSVLNIKNLGELRVTKIESNSIKNRRYIYIMTDRFWRI